MINKINKKIMIFSLVIFIFFSCTFDYGESESSSDDLPDLIMENVEYVRVRSSDPIARFRAERAERYDQQGIMLLQNFSFEQYGEKGEEINAFGKAGKASVNIETGDIFMDNGVLIEVESENIIIHTKQLDWKDEERILSTGENDEVNIQQNNGTDFIGIGLRVDARRRTWEFFGSVTGRYIHEGEPSDDTSDTHVKTTDSEGRKEQTDYDTIIKETGDTYFYTGDMDYLWEK
jgi:LPS export ABC transporter protein LptC